MSLYAIFWVIVASFAPVGLNSEMSIVAPSAASLSASSLPVLFAWPLIHSKVVPPLLFPSLFMTGLIRFVCGEFAKSMSVLYELSSQISFWSPF